MKSQQQLMLTFFAFFESITAYSPSSGSPAFLRQRSPSVESPIRKSIETLEADGFDFKTINDLEQMFRGVTGEEQFVLTTVEDEEARLGMPWKESISDEYKGELLYMPFWEWHMDFMKNNLKDLQVMSCSNGKTDFSFNENRDKKARIVSMCLRSNEYRKIRLTYYDAGDTTQVYNAVFYPDPKYNLPILGVDLLAFNRRKYLTIVDFQPLHSDEDDHAIQFENRLKPIKDQYDTLKGRMSSKFYDETQFFSQQMLFARFEDEGVVTKELFPAFQSYVKTHLDLIRETKPDPTNEEFVLERQKAYDLYSAERDPATGLFTAMFGNDWAQDFVHDFLFSMSERPKDDTSIESVTTQPVTTSKR